MIGSGLPYKIILFVYGVTPKASMKGTVVKFSVGYPECCSMEAGCRNWDSCKTESSHPKFR